MHILFSNTYAPINIMPRYPPGLCRGKVGAFGFDFTPKLSLYVGNLTAHHTHVQKCEHLQVNSLVNRQVLGGERIGI